MYSSATFSAFADELSKLAELPEAASAVPKTPPAVTTTAPKAPPQVTATKTIPPSPAESNRKMVVHEPSLGQSTIPEYKNTLKRQGYPFHVSPYNPKDPRCTWEHTVSAPMSIPYGMTKNRTQTTFDPHRERFDGRDHQEARERWRESAKQGKIGPLSPNY